MKLRRAMIAHLLNGYALYKVKIMVRAVVVEKGMLWRDMTAPVLKGYLI